MSADLNEALTTAKLLPDDVGDATLIGRVWDPAAGGPSVVRVTAEDVIDLSGSVATVRDITEHPDPAGYAAGLDGPSLGSPSAIVANTPPERRDASLPGFLSPVDVHVVKAAGVTFPVSMIERVIEERAHGDAGAAAKIREQIGSVVGGSLQDLKPGSEEAARVKDMLVERGWWSQYLEVGIGPDPEVFTKAPVLASVGTGVEIGLHADSAWNNPEPEVVLVVSSTGRVVGATLGNDVNLRDVEGRSALLLPKAKDNNASAAIGPFLRLFDEGYRMDQVRAADVTLTIEGTDGFRLEANSPLSKISRDPEDLVSHVIGDHHQYPDGFALYLGTLFAPTQDRGEGGSGFTHALGDIVTISEPGLGSLVNRVTHSHQAEPWTMGIDDFYRNLLQRGLLR
ncbi:fumarylacetoacetate hydrolase family protein [Pseudactinotalea sp. Z1732]|uniref:fumarylacetoacetate hydrolase family protein n=1 Tax=Pseudactinotalea sp. Z1732 TaxID=3413026 RepID=UPI003C797D41